MTLCMAKPYSVYLLESAKKAYDSYLRIMMIPFTAWRGEKKIKKQNRGYYPVFITSLLP